MTKRTLAEEEQIFRSQFEEARSLWVHSFPEGKAGVRLRDLLHELCQQHIDVCRELSKVRTHDDAVIARNLALFEEYVRWLEALAADKSVPEIEREDISMYLTHASARNSDVRQWLEERKLWKQTYDSLTAKERTALAVK